MKFAKELEALAIPEWSGSYLDYKQAKKRLKAVAKALRSVPSRESHHPELPLRAENGSTTTSQRPAVNERSPLQAKKQPGESNERAAELKRMTSYGSIIGSPPHSPAQRLKHSVQDAPSLHLPGPAANSLIEDSLDEEDNPLTRNKSVNLPVPRPAPNHAASQLSHTGNAYQVKSPVDHPAGAGSTPKNGSSRSRGILRKRTNSMPSVRPLTQRMFSLRGGTTPRKGRDDNDVALEMYKEVDFREAEFFLFLDKELMKVENFYKSKEDEAKERLETLRQQLHIMRDFRLEEIIAAEQRHKSGREEQQRTSHEDAGMNGTGQHQDTSKLAVTREMVSRPFSKSIDMAAEAFDKFRPGHVGKTSQAMGNLGTPDEHNWTPDHNQRDYSRKPLKDVPYRVAKRKMKLALQEYYRGLELVKSFAIVNRTAFRKINKKYDKAVNAQPKQRYMAEKVNKSYFVTSDETDNLMSSVEDLYSRYFEKGNRKIAVSKLRAKNANSGHYTGAVVRTGALLAAGAVLSLQGIVAGTNNLFVTDPRIKLETGFLLQLYGGYFLIWTLATLFTLSTRFFTINKVNYGFIFELDNRHALNWRELNEMPAWFFFIFGLTMYLNFEVEAGGEPMYRYWFVVLLGLAVVCLFNPAPIFYHRARRWFLYSMWRLVPAGLYAVEYRDFFLGDIFCSLTYAMGNIEVFFCLYTTDWANPGSCTSGTSRTLGFLTTLPAIWRALQCLRRYWDTRVWFPHLANFGKYIFTILMYMSLSLYRIEKTFEMKSLFIAVACMNSVYTAVWDIGMDWSLGDWDAKYFLLRRTLGYRKNIWLYYFAMIIDPILRFNWIFYAIYTHDQQHSTIVSFMVSLSEVFRRGLWTLFRVENEHCSNIKKEMASRDLPLPYKLSHDEDSQDEEEHRSQKSLENLIADPLGNHTSNKPPLSLRESRGHVPTSDISSVNLEGQSQKPIKPRNLLRRSSGLTSESASNQPKFSLRNGTVVRQDGSIAEEGAAGSATATGRSDVDLERQATNTGSSSLRARKGGRSGESAAPTDSPIANALHRVGTAIRTAHEKDFERKKPSPGDQAQGMDGAESSSEDEDDEDDEPDDRG
ncbi:unnamed protein product [Zymoseptoria tritici ST99CH_1E4]|uniref:SPX domain-containing protein n=1 Tax=Zymoseptoria tritici ST99CH_1E4 TaxID=1276532 RepID=A0A2H1GU60_ZYMTR|nr:unnamed protein product [Zymoseptoria tritici ST99CH_1E4]